jgi:hypothetical protein
VIRRLPIAAFALLICSSGHAADGDWSWVRAVPYESEKGEIWEVSQGTGTITMDGRKFKGELRLDLSKTKGPGSDILLEGTIVGDKVIASATYVGTDADPETFRGKIRKLPDGNGWETDRIVLSGDWADAFLGITRRARIQP